MAHHLSIQKMSIVSVIPWAVGVTGLIAGGFACDWLVKKTGRAIHSRKIVLITSLGAVGGFVHFIANLAGIVAPALTGFSCSGWATSRARSC